MSRDPLARTRRASGARPGRSGFQRAFDLFLAVLILALLTLLATRLDRAATIRPSGAATVNDGDTLTVDGERIRLRGIDAPEYAQMCMLNGKSYACGRAARDALRVLIGGRPVACAGWERDRYGRLLATCMAGDTDLNRSLVEQGWAVAFGDFQAEEFSARQAGRGLWAGEFDRPRQWRDSHGSLAETDHDYLGAVVNWLRAIFGFG